MDVRDEQDWLGVQVRHVFEVGEVTLLQQRHHSHARVLPWGGGVGGHTTGHFKTLPPLLIRKTLKEIHLLLSPCNRVNMQGSVSCRNLI